MPVAVKSDARWIADFRARFDPWWASAQAQLATRDEASALGTYPWPTFSEAPWTPFRRRLSRCRVALVTTAGLFRPGVDVAFDGASLLGDASFRVIPATADAGEFAIAHRRFPPAPAEADINTIFPLALLRDAVAAGTIGYVAPTHYSTIGHVLPADELALVTAPTLAALMREEGVDVAIVVPVSALCHQSAGLIQRELEATGITTISLSNHPEITARVRPPRSVHVRFPTGTMFGEPGNRAQQVTVLNETLAALSVITEPGGHLALDVRWEGAPVSSGGNAFPEGGGS
jgi:D-proline reductase (dithiol) PrdB